ncbi:MAG: tail fiber domain-containing protein, partial [Lachnospiraceae bacterium]|nr:tail fiber domain-containing protein [Lachnospiraceae bacterium]
GKPSSFPPSSHKHSKSDITDFPSSMPASDVSAWAKAASKPSYSWNEIGGKPSTFTPASHNHNLNNITDLSNVFEIYNNGLCFLNDIFDICIKSASRYSIIGISLPNKRLTVYENVCNFELGTMRMLAMDKEVVIWTSGGEMMKGLALITERNSKGCLEPETDGCLKLGQSGRRWADIYSVNSAISTSGREAKKEISYIGNASREYNGTYMDDAQLISLILGLKACVYKFKENDSSRPHHGLIAQDVEELLQKLGIKDHAAFIKSPKTKDIEAEEEYTDNDGIKKTRKRTVQEEIPGEYIYGLRYEEFIADIIRFVQILYNRDTDLGNALKEREERTESMEKRIEILENIIKQMV